jgi:hypothetical protein
MKIFFTFLCTLFFQSHAFALGSGYREIVIERVSNVTYWRYPTWESMIYRIDNGVASTPGSLKGSNDISVLLSGVIVGNSYGSVKVATSNASLSDILNTISCYSIPLQNPTRKIRISGYLIAGGSTATYTLVSARCSIAN